MSRTWILPALLLGLGAALVAMQAAVRAEDEEGGPPRPPEIGRPAPEFRLNDQDGRAVDFDAYRKDQWLVLAFFPKAATPG